MELDLSSLKRAITSLEKSISSYHVLCGNSTTVLEVYEAMD